MENKTHGGRRKGSGRKKKEETKVIGFRVKNRHLPELKKQIKNVISEFDKKQA